MLRTLSLRPSLLVDQEADRVGARNPSKSLVGRPAPWGRERVLEALKLNNNPPAPQFPARPLTDPEGRLLLDPTDDSVVGMPQLWIARYLRATRTRNTRRL